MTGGGHLLVGVGSEFRGDDRAGLIVARAVAAVPDSGWTVTEITADLSRLITLWDGYDAVTVVDCARSSRQAPGTRLGFDGLTDDLPRDAFPASSHLLGLAEAVAMARALDQLPPQLTIEAIVGDRFETGTDPQTAVLETAAEVARALHPQATIAAGTANPHT